MSDNRTHADPVQSARIAKRSVRRRRKRWATLLSCLGIVAAFVVPATTFNFKGFLIHALSEETQSANWEMVRTGTVVRQTDDGQCVLMKFDNDSGRTIDHVKHCDKTVVRDAQGVPVPMGTVHRLDAISKSFLGNAHQAKP
jgi:hypothetical protein